MINHHPDPAAEVFDWILVMRRHEERFRIATDYEQQFEYRADMAVAQARAFELINRMS